MTENKDKKEKPFKNPTATGLRVRYNPETDKYEYYYIENGKEVKL